MNLTLRKGTVGITTSNSIFEFYSCLAGLACAPLTAEDLRKNTVMFSMSRAWRLGNAVKLAQKEKRCPVDAVLESQNGKLLISGKVCVTVFDR
jgi:DUF917 family protein